MYQKVYKCFKKIRISDWPNQEIEKLFKKRKVLRSKSDDKSKLELSEAEAKLAEKCAEDNYNKIMEEIFWHNDWLINCKHFL